MTPAQLSARALDDLLGQWRGAAPANEELADRIRLLVLDGRISADVRLPAERELAQRLALSRTTVTSAYRRLRDTGYAHSLRGSGTRTMLPGTRPTQHDQPPELIDLTKAALPAPGLFTAALDEAVVEVPLHLGDTGYDSLGLARLRGAIADRYTERGLPTEPRQVIVTTGAQSAIWLLARTILRRGDHVLTESPSYPNAFDAIQLAGGRVTTVPVTTHDGWDIDALTSALARTRPTMAYLMPDFHNPTGRSMPVEQRERMLEAAAAAGAVVIADETAAELDIDRPGVFPPLAAMAEPAGADVVQIGSASKLFWGGLRIGWIRATPELVQRIGVARAATDMAAPVLDQLITAQLIAHTPEIIRERREQLRTRRDVVRKAVGDLLPGWSLPPRLHGGLAAWVGLGAAASSQLTLSARAHGLLVSAGPRFGIDGAFERFLRIPITADPQQLTAAIAVLAEVWPMARRLAGSESPSTVA